MSIRATIWVLLLILIVSGCGPHKLDRIRAAPADYPDDQLAVLHCDRSCDAVLDSQGNTIAKRNGGFLVVESLTEIELAPGSYQLRIVQCHSNSIVLPHYFFNYKLDLNPGIHYYVSSSVKIYSNYICYSNLRIKDEEGFSIIGYLEKGPLVCTWTSLCGYALRGDTKAQRNIAGRYEYGLKGVDVDLIKSYRWYDLASRSGDTKAAELRDIVVKRMTADQLARISESATDWSPSLDECGPQNGGSN